MPPDVLEQWLAHHLPASWQVESVELAVDNDEVLIVLCLSGPGNETDPGPRIATFREQTRDERVALARLAEPRFGRKISWGARVGAHTEVFTATSVPVMTRLRMSERRVLDTLIDAGVARSRSDALAWCVRLVADNEQGWIDALRTAFVAVEAVRDEGPRSRRVRPEG